MVSWLNPCMLIEEASGRSRRVTISIRPRAFLEDGYYRAIPAALGNSGDASLPIGRRGLLETCFADKLAGQSPQVHIGRGQNHIRMSALGTNNVNGAPVLDGMGNVIGRRYNGAWVGADLEWLDIGYKVKEHVYLWTGHPRQIEVRVDGLAGRLVASPRGWDLQDDSGRPVLWAGAGYLYKPDDPNALTVPVTTTVRTLGGKQIYTYTLPDGDWTGWVLDPTWTSQPGAAAGKDAMIPQNSPTGNFATRVWIDTGNWNGPGFTQRSLLQFDVSSLGSASNVISAILTVTNGLADISNQNRICRAFRVKRNWVEAEATWNVYSTGNNWGTAGCADTVNDREVTDIGSVTFINGAANGDQFALTLTAPAVEDWINSTFTNNGLLLQMDTENFDLWYLASSDHATAAWRPKLTVDYLLPGGSIGRGRTPTLTQFAAIR